MASPLASHSHLSDRYIPTPSGGPSSGAPALLSTPRSPSRSRHGKLTGTRNKLRDDVNSNTLESYLADARIRIGKLHSGLWHHLAHNQDIKQALLAFRAKAKLATTEANLYEPLDDFLNAISSAVVAYAKTHNITMSGKVVWFRAHNSKVYGDFMNKAGMPDRICVVIPADTQHDTDLPTSWQEIAGVGEDKFKRDEGMGQLKSYMANQLRYRVDYPVVRGLSIDKTQQQGFRVRLASMNSRGFWSSPYYDITELEPWVAYVCEVYEVHAIRIEDIQPVSEEAGVFHRVTLFEKEMCVAPAYAKAPPGSTTFVGFALEIDGSGGEVKAKWRNTLRNAAETLPPVGVFKVSWQYGAEACHEKRMYDAAHHPTMNPGLAFPDAAKRLLDHAVESHAHGSVAPLAYPEVMNLRSFGEPLSQCRTPRELLEVIYDACLTLEDMYVAGVLHRDVSGRNIMCHPVHKAAIGNPTIAQHRCINFVLGREARDYKCLVMDLDHAARLTKPARPEEAATPTSQTTGKTGAYQPTGTPMFMAMDLLNVPRRQYKAAAFHQTKGVPKLFAPRKSLLASTNDTFARAFSLDAAKTHGYQDAEHLNLYDSTWLEDRLTKLHQHFDETVFRVVRTDAEDAQYDEGRKEEKARLLVKPSTAHQLRHDIESCFWVLYFYLARAKPLDSGEEVNDPAFYRNFVRDILAEDGAGSTKYAASLPGPSEVLHPDLQQLADVLEDMYRYLLAIPWQRMEDPNFRDDLRLHPAHTAVVMRRILLTTLTSRKYQQVLDTELCTAHPRDPQIELDEYTPQTSIYTTSTGISQTFERPNASIGTTTSNNAGIKRPEPADMTNDNRPAKRRKTGINAGSAEDLVRKIRRDLMWYSAGPLREDPNPESACS